MPISQAFKNTHTHTKAQHKKTKEKGSARKRDSLILQIFLKAGRISLRKPALGKMLACRWHQGWRWTKVNTSLCLRQKNAPVATASGMSKQLMPGGKWPDPWQRHHSPPQERTANCKRKALMLKIRGWRGDAPGVSSDNNREITVSQLRGCIQTKGSSTGTWWCAHGSLLPRVVRSGMGALPEARGTRGGEYWFPSIKRRLLLSILMNEHLALLWLAREQREQYFLMQNRLRNAQYPQYFGYPYPLCQDYSGITASVTDLNDILLQSYIRPFSPHLPHFQWMLKCILLMHSWDSRTPCQGYLHVTLSLSYLQPMGKCLSCSVWRATDAGEETVMLCIDTQAQSTGKTQLPKPSWTVPVPSCRTSETSLPHLWDGQTHLQQLCQILNIYSWKFSWCLSFPIYIFKKKTKLSRKHFK